MTEATANTVVFLLNRKVLHLRAKEKVVSDIFLTRLNKGYVKSF